MTLIYVEFVPRHWNRNAACYIPECWVASVGESPDETEIGIQSRAVNKQDAIDGILSELRKSSKENLKIVEI